MKSSGWPGARVPPGPFIHRAANLFEAGIIKVNFNRSENPDEKMPI
jgi:hypothetical protein